MKQIIGKSKMPESRLANVNESTVVFNEDWRITTSCFPDKYFDWVVDEFVVSEIDKEYFDLQENRFSNFINAPRLPFL